MSKFIELESFYKIIPDQEVKTAASEIGHFNIFRIEDILMPEHKKVTYSRRNFFKISLVTGHSKIHYADQCFEVNGPVLVFTNPMVPYFWERISEHHSGFVCIFTEDFFNRFGPVSHYPVFQSAQHAIVPLSEDEVTAYNNLFLRMFDEFRGDYIYKYDLLRNLLMETIHGAQKMQPAAGNSTVGSNASERISSLFTELLERQFPIELSNQIMQIKSPSDFAKQLNIHVNHLNKALKENTGQTTSQLISARILQEAKILLKSTNWTISEIGRSLGFEEANHFSSFFKSKITISPAKFRQTID